MLGLALEFKEAHKALAKLTRLVTSYKILQKYCEKGGQRRMSGQGLNRWDTREGFADTQLADSISNRLDLRLAEP